MAVGIDVVKDDLETLFVRVNLTGLSPGTKYDVLRLQMRYTGKDDTGVRHYDRELPDRRELWSSVGHRVGWTAPSATSSFRDYECPKRPTVYFVVASSAVSPYEWDFSDGNYPVSRGVLDTEVVHFAQDLKDANLGLQPDAGHLLVRSTAELGLYVSACVVEMDGPRYTARGSEFSVMGNQFPVFVSDTRETRRGSVTLLTRDLGAYQDLRRIVFPSSGRIRPVSFQSGGDSTLLLDDMRVLPLDVEVEQVTPERADLRYIHIDYLETDATVPLVQRTGDNDNMVNEPVANFTISDVTPGRNQWVTLTDTSTGQYDSWDWTIGHASLNAQTSSWPRDWIAKRYTKGPHRVFWPHRGTKQIKLRVYGSGAGAHSRVKTVTVHK